MAQALESAIELLAFSRIEPDKLNLKGSSNPALIIRSLKTYWTLLLNLKSTMLKLFDFSSYSIKEWHRKWLGNIYEWAGTTRSVNMRKGSFDFAAATQIPTLLDDFEKSLLSQFDELPNIREESLICLLAKVHIEF